MDIIIGLIVLGLFAYVAIKVYLNTVTAAAELAKMVIKQAIIEADEDIAADWDDIK